jgi:hypothetical protein
MHLEILSKEQEKLLPLINDFSKTYYLVGGTAIALHLGHRRSIDYDLFTSSQRLNVKAIKEKIYRKGYGNYENLFEDDQQKHLMLEGVKLTFFCFPYQIPANDKFFKNIKLPSLLRLGAMKAYALGGRNKWKDYVDLSFILKIHSLREVSDVATELFAGAFNERLFKEQLTYFDDIDYAEEVEYLPGFEVTQEEIKQFLSNVGMEPF